MFETKIEKQEKVYIVCPYTSLDNADYRTKELEQLAESALLEIVMIQIQHGVRSFR